MSSVAFFDCETNGIDEAARITCASVVAGDGAVTSYHSGLGSFMSKALGLRLLEDLLAFDRVVTFNGTSFDFQKLFRLTGDGRAKALARRSVDVMLQFTGESGFFSSMGSFAVGTFGPDGAGKSNTGGWAAKAWFSGQGEAVLAYCEDDVKLLKALYDHGLASGQLTRVTKAGKARPWVIATEPGDSMFKAADECLAAWRANPPNTSWMTDPPDLAKACGWMGA